MDKQQKEKDVLHDAEVIEEIQDFDEVYQETEKINHQPTKMQVATLVGGSGRRRRSRSKST